MRSSSSARPSTSPASTIPAYLMDDDVKQSPRSRSVTGRQDKCASHSSARARRAQGTAGTQAVVPTYHKLSLELIRNMSGEGLQD